MASYCSG